MKFEKKKSKQSFAGTEKSSNLALSNIDCVVIKRVKIV